jgi:MurNAc alpha-1-phosphate uridylyltransferase
MKLNTERNMKAMILAAGLGTRLKPWTDFHPKALACVNGKPLLQHNIEYLQKFGITDVIVNVHHFADQIIGEIEKQEGWGSNIAISDESDVVLETGGGLINAHWYFDEEDFVLMNVDILTDLDLQAMVDYHQRHQPLATLAVTNRTSSRYLLFDEMNTLCGWRNEKTGEEKRSNDHPVLTQKAFSGLQVVNPAIFRYITQRGKFSLIDAYLQLAQEHPIPYFDHSGGKFIDVGRPEAIEQAAELFKQIG